MPSLWLLPFVRASGGPGLPDVSGPAAVPDHAHCAWLARVADDHLDVRSVRRAAADRRRDHGADVNTLALIGGGVLIVVGLIYAVYRLGASRAEERIHRYLAERQARAGHNAIDAHDKARKEGEELL